MLEPNLKQVEETLLAYKQEHVLTVLRQLPQAAKEKLAAQIEQIDFESLFKSIAEQNRQPVSFNERISPIPFEDWEDYGKQEQAAFTARGWELLRSGRIGAVVVAGGQGSRLGHEGPKGTLDIGLPSRKSLFQLQAERLLYLSRKAGKAIPWYIMTSPDNHEATVAFFRSADYFGYSARDCFFFPQNTMPALDFNGKLLLSGEGTIRLAPSGNGECFAALKRSGAIDDMKQRGLEWLFYYNVDNALIKVADPAFIGVAASHDNPIATKVIEKTDAKEKIGVICLKNGLPAVLEYTEIPDKVKKEKTIDGRLFYGLGHISIHLFKLDFIEAHADAEIPYHVAAKKMDVWDAEVGLIKPAEPNAYKLERFIFDFFPLASRLTVLKTSRQEEFAPVKNKTGVDSPESARKLIRDLHMRWLQAAGISTEQLRNAEIEISPLLLYGGEGLRKEEWIEILKAGASE